MKILSNRPVRSCHAVTMVELLVVVVVLGTLAAIVLEIAARRTDERVYRIKCVNNLKNIGFAFATFATDHTNRFPIAVSTTFEGTEQPAPSDEVWRRFVALSNQLSSPQIVHCPNDKRRTSAVDWQTLRNQNVSYFVGLSATPNDPMAWLAGDRNLDSNGRRLGPGPVALATNTPVSFGKDIHNRQGNLLRGDGSVQQLSNSRLGTALTDSGLATNRLLIP